VDCDNLESFLVGKGGGGGKCESFAAFCTVLVPRSTSVLKVILVFLQSAAKWRAARRIRTRYEHHSLHHYRCPDAVRCLPVVCTKAMRCAVLMLIPSSFSRLPWSAQCVVMHSGRDQKERTENLEAFKDGDVRFLISTGKAILINVPVAASVLLLSGSACLHPSTDRMTACRV
jgi:hypothetical protein